MIKQKSGNGPAFPSFFINSSGQTYFHFINWVEIIFHYPNSSVGSFVYGGFCAAFRKLPNDLDEAEICFLLCSVFITVGLRSQGTTTGKIPATGLPSAKPPIAVSSMWIGTRATDSLEWREQTCGLSAKFRICFIQ